MPKYAFRAAVLFGSLISACGAPPTHDTTAPPPAGESASIDDAAAFVAELEERLRSAETIAIDMELETFEDAGPREISLALAGERARWHLSGLRDGAPLVVDVESDPTTTEIRTEGGETGSLPTMTDHRDFLAVGVVRAGILATAGWTVIGQEMRDFSDGQSCCWAEIGDVELGAPETIDGKELAVIHARVGAFGQRRGRLTLWIDPARRVPVRREMRSLEGGDESRTVERYTRFDIQP